VERFFALLTEKQIRRGIHRSTRELEQAIRHYLDSGQRGPLLLANFSYRTLGERRICLTFDQACSMGLKSGE
jgi:hypothetical protein